jgi:hypothetical protein
MTKAGKRDVVKKLIHNGDVTIFLGKVIYDGASDICMNE